MVLGKPPHCPEPPWSHVSDVLVVVGWPEHCALPGGKLGPLVLPVSQGPKARTGSGEAASEPPPALSWLRELEAPLSELRFSIPEPRQRLFLTTAHEMDKTMHILQMWKMTL